MKSRKEMINFLITHKMDTVENINKLSPYLLQGLYNLKKLAVINKQETPQQKTIQIKAMEWYDKQNGNSYFSARAYINSELAAILPFQYGYDDHYIDMVNQQLSTLGLIGTKKNTNTGGYDPLWRYCEDNNIILVTSIDQGCLQRDVKAFGKE